MQRLCKSEMQPLSFVRDDNNMNWCGRKQALQCIRCAAEHAWLDTVAAAVDMSRHVSKCLVFQFSPSWCRTICLASPLEEPFQFTNV